MSSCQLLYSGLSIVDYDKVRSELEHLISLCGAEAIFVLVDEWSSVSMSIQPLLAEMIRKTLTLSNMIFIKLASLQFFTRTSVASENMQRIGLQSGIDISPLEDLDSLLTFDVDSQSVKDFLTTLLYKHMSSHSDAIQKLTVKELEDMLYTEIFDGQKVYEEVVRASEGNPRDFLSIMTQCCAATRAENGRRISQENVVKVALHHFERAKTYELRNSSDALKLFSGIFASVTETRQKLFLVSIDKAMSDRRIQELWHYRFIHMVNQSYSYLDKNMKAREYTVFSMDYGKLLSLKANERGEKFVNTMVNAAGVAAGSMAGFGARLLAESFVGEKLRKIAGKALVSSGDIETADLSNIDYLVENCVIDKLL